jgi:hypothetical protein
VGSDNTRWTGRRNNTSYGHPMMRRVITPLGPVRHSVSAALLCNEMTVTPPPTDPAEGFDIAIRIARLEHTSSEVEPAPAPLPRCAILRR